MRWLRVLIWNLKRSLIYRPPAQAPPDVWRIVMESAHMDDRIRQMARAHELGFAYVDLDRITIDRATIALIPREIVVTRRAIPVKRVENTLFLALENPNDLKAIDAARIETRCRTIPVLATSEQIDAAIEKYYPAVE